ncbi:hypothetical protein FQR65_LT19761 [Abscondita terminalis]|nr:hypothetical protein FQR65_LT19761 [Abscondita terminalis]
MPVCNPVPLSMGSTHGPSCNMSIEMGARGREFAPKGEEWDKSLAYWQTLYSDEDAQFDSVLTFKAEDIAPMITYGTNPGMGMGIRESIPPTAAQPRRQNSLRTKKQLRIYGICRLFAPVLGKPVDYVFIGSCSKQVEKQAIEEGLDKIFEAAGFQLREPGCSACLGMNEDKIPAGKYCVSTSNRNFEGRQGPNARTMLAKTSDAVPAVNTQHGLYKIMGLMLSSVHSLLISSREMPKQWCTAIQVSDEFLENNFETVTKNPDTEVIVDWKIRPSH